MTKYYLIRIGDLDDTGEPVTADSFNDIKDMVGEYPFDWLGLDNVGLYSLEPIPPLLKGEKVIDVHIPSA